MEDATRNTSWLLSPRVIAVTSTTWIAILGAGFVLMNKYASGQGAVNAPQKAEFDSISVSHDSHTLVMAVHPRCPCTRASLSELQRLEADLKGQLIIHLLVYTPTQGSDPAWARDAFDTLRRFGFSDRAEIDYNGSKANQLGCLTSGSVVLFSPDGEPKFWGGITSSRGHEGPNRGVDAVRSIVAEGLQGSSSTPVFGCPITGDPTSACTGEDCGGSGS